MYEFILREFNRLAASQTPLTRSTLAARIGRDASQITRWLNDPANLEFESFSDLMVGMAVDPRRLVARLSAASQENRPENEEGSSVLALAPDPDVPGITSTSSRIAEYEYQAAS